MKPLRAATRHRE